MTHISLGTHKVYIIRKDTTQYNFHYWYILHNVLKYKFCNQQRAEFCLCSNQTTKQRAPHST